MSKTLLLMTLSLFFIYMSTPGVAGRHSRVFTGCVAKGTKDHPDTGNNQLCEDLCTKTYPAYIKSTSYAGLNPNHCPQPTDTKDKTYACFCDYNDTNKKTRR